MVEMFKLVVVSGLIVSDPPPTIQTVYYETWMQCMVAGIEMKQKHLNPAFGESWDCKPVMLPSTLAK